MIIGIPKEIKNHENRVSMVPFAVEALCRAGHKVNVEAAAGKGSGFSDSDYQLAGANIMNAPADIFESSDMIVKVKEPQPSEIAMIRENQIVFTYFHFAADEQLTKGIIDTNSIAIAYENVQSGNGSLPLLIPMSEVAGRMAVYEGAKCLEENMGGKGLLISGVPGVAPATVTILGGGIVGMNAAKLAAGLGAQVYILDVNPDRLKYLNEIMPPNVITLYSNSMNLMELLPRTDLIIGAVLIVGARAPKLITRDMLKDMQPGSVIVDVAVDQGGCIETCRPTTHAYPTFNVNGIIHYCVANMPGAVPYTSTLALANVTFPYIYKIANQGCIPFLKSSSEFRSGLNIFKGKVTHKGVSEAFNLDYHDALSVLN